METLPNLWNGEADEEEIIMFPRFPDIPPWLAIAFLLCVAIGLAAVPVGIFWFLLTR